MSALAILSEIFLPGWKGAALNTAVLVAMQVWFLKLTIYQDLLWQPWMTAVTFPGYFLAVHWYRQAAIRHGLRKGWPRTVFRILLSMWAVKIYWATMTRMLELVIFSGAARRTWRLALAAVFFLTYPGVP